jgi:hypothetical protein
LRSSGQAVRADGTAVTAQRRWEAATWTPRRPVSRP